MEIAGAAFPITPLLATCTKIVTILHNVGKKFKRAPLMMTSIATECSLINVALAQLRSFDWATVSTHADGREKGVRATESIILGCTLTLSVIEEYSLELQDYVEGTPISPTEQMGIMARARVLWKEDEMRELLLQLRGYQTGLTSLIRAAQDEDFGESSDVAAATYAALLQRSRSSRARKPLSIRAAMQQAATYSNMSSKTPTAPSHASQPSATTVQPRQPIDATSIASKTNEAKVNNGEVAGSIVLDSYDTGGSATAVTPKKSAADAARRKRPAFLSLQPEESEAKVEGQTVQLKRSKDQMRKSSPTVGEKFKFVPGQPPLPDAVIELPPRSAPSTVGHTDDLLDADAATKKAKRPSKEPFMTPPTSSPPTAPLPEVPSEPPSRSPSRSRSPGVAPKSPVKSILRTSVRKEITNRNSAPEPAQASTLSPKPPATAEDHSHSETSTLVDREPLKPQTPPTPYTDVSGPATPRFGAPEPRKQKSNSSVRDQIMVLPETARLRKQASNDLLRKQSSAELLSQTGLHEAIPALPTSNQDRYVVGNAFGRRGSESQGSQPSSSKPISRATSADMLTDLTRKRSGTDTAQDAAFVENKTQSPRQGARGVQRSSSDAQRPAYLNLPGGGVRQDANGHSPTSDAVTTPSTIGTPTSPPHGSPPADAWPLNPARGYQPELAQHQTHYGPRRNVQTAERFHTRTPSHEKNLPSRSLSPETTPRGSRSNTSHANQPRQQRSRSNTLLSIASETGEADKRTPGEITSATTSAHTSVSPSVMSAQWYRSPQERLNIGPRMSVSDQDPWGALDEDVESQADHLDSRFAPKPRLGGMLGAGLPGRAPSRVNEDTHPHEPPRSPLLTDGFLRDVKAGLPKDDPKNQARSATPTLGPRSGTSMTSYEDSSLSSGANSKKIKKEKKEKKKKESSRPGFRELWKEYKSSGESWYTAQYTRAAEEQRIEAAARDKRPATGSTASASGSGSGSGSGRANGSMDAQASFPTRSAAAQQPASPRQSSERGGSVSSGSGQSRMEKEKPVKKKGGLTSVKELWGEYKANTNAWYTSAYKEEHVRHLETPDLLGRRDTRD